jgi:hypothetical protein
MERINVFKGKSGLAKFFVVFGIFFTLAGRPKEFNPQFYSPIYGTAPRFKFGQLQTY